MNCVFSLAVQGKRKEYENWGREQVEQARERSSWELSGLRLPVTVDTARRMPEVPDARAIGSIKRGRVSYEAMKIQGHQNGDRVGFAIDRLMYLYFYY